MIQRRRFTAELKRKWCSICSVEHRGRQHSVASISSTHSCLRVGRQNFWNELPSLYIKLRTSPRHRAGTRVHLFDEPSEHGGQKATSSTRLDRFKKLALCLPLFLS